MEPIEQIIARAEQQAVREWEAEQAPPAPWMDCIDTSFRADIVKGRILGYRAEHLGWGLTELANCWPWALTRRGIRRKVERIRRRHERGPKVVEVVRGER
jgi:hypothetical protein